jgi:acylphosphatase
MGYIIFEKHPGDLIIIDCKDNNIALIQIEAFKFKIKGLIKLTPQGNFKVTIDFPSNKQLRESFIATLSLWLIKKEILEYNACS